MGLDSNYEVVCDRCGRPCLVGESDALGGAKGNPLKRKCLKCGATEKDHLRKTAGAAKVDPKKVAEGPGQ